MFVRFALMKKKKERKHRMQQHCCIKISKTHKFDHGTITLTLTITNFKHLEIKEASKHDIRIHAAQWKIHQGT